MKYTNDALTVTEAAAYLGISRQTLYNLRSAGVGPASYLIGNRLRYDRRNLDLYIAQRKAATLVAG
ncbi:helix-turn-helix transcriptional regulator [Gordonia sp. NPDC058843]|uniref:helix-turn-helix transcriptional regulator n=1 Tax=Gordonia sp. NPDC058843 TaxID=3346648 RepID=UPI00369FFA0E